MTKNPSGMTCVEGGFFNMGSNGDEVWRSDGEGPVRQVKLNSFFIDVLAVTNRQFKAFVQDTGHVTEAERFGWSFVFVGFLRDKRRASASGISHPQSTWWHAVRNSCWKRPTGSGSSIRKILDHPVVHVSWNDARAYALWSGKRLLTEAEWEFAARGGLDGKLYPWGDELTPEGRHQCNIWQGRFPDANTKADGFFGTAPADAFPPNHFGLYNMVGNVWEWCSDWWATKFHADSVDRNPSGPPAGHEKVIRGGSYLCHHSYCNRYRNSARTKNTPDSSTGNIGFRCGMDA